eukprot:gene5435-10902_t
MWAKDFRTSKRKTLKMTLATVQRIRRGILQLGTVLTVAFTELYEMPSKTSNPTTPPNHLHA